jgi:hypothetical protein
MNLPPFTADGLLPPGDFALTLNELKNSILVKRFISSSSNWDEVWRAKLVDNLSILVNQLIQVGITEIFVDGSFVEDKEHPNDIDGYFACTVKQLSSGELQRELNKLDPHKVWTWDPRSRVPYANSTKKQLPMWHRYRVELYPHFGQGSGITDQFGHELQFPSAFRQSRRDHKEKGIIKIITGGSP